MEQIVGVKVRKSLKVYTYLTNKLNVAKGDLVVVETDRGVTTGIVVFGPKETDSVQQGMRKLIRIADEE
ncbi:MAG: stage 0 sporulation protein, partial [Deltaproteobacteria bacterium]|nr:stage 0 sporulation protein [Deltaproteobacteria bacterium]